MSERDELLAAAAEVSAESGAALLERPLGEYDDPAVVLADLLAGTGPDGVVVAVTNDADASALVSLLRSDPLQAADATRGRPVGQATAFKLLLEAGFSPDLVRVVPSDLGDMDLTALLAAAAPLWEQQRIDKERAARQLSAGGYVFLCRPIEDVAEDRAVPLAGQRPVTFVACINDDLQLGSNLLASPALAPGGPHQLLTYRGMSSAAEGLNKGLSAAEHELVVFIQQDIYVPSWWPARLVRQWELADGVSGGDGPPWLAGAFGLRYREGGREHVGHVVDRDSLLREQRALPARVDGLDELVLVVPRDTSLRVEPSLGWHLYGTDLALQVHRAEGWTAVLDLPCHHNSLYHRLDESYRHSEAVLATRWPRELPIYTNTSTISEDPRDARMRALVADLEKGHRDFADRGAALLGAESEVARLNEQVVRLNDQVGKMRGRIHRLRGRSDEDA